MGELQIFRNEEFGSIRTIVINNEPWFVGKDVALILGYSNPQKAIRDHVDEEDRTMNETFTVNGTSPTLVNESGIYSLIIQSKLPNAKKFKHWVTSEVLPSIRHNGGYIMNQEQMTPEQIVANALIVANNIIEQKNRQIEEMKPKADFFDAVADSKTAISMNDVAKVLAIKGYGRNKIFEFLRNEKILDRNNIPYQRYVDAGWFRVVEQKYNRGSEVVITKRTLVYQKGVDGIRKMIFRWKEK